MIQTIYQPTSRPVAKAAGPLAAFIVSRGGERGTAEGRGEQTSPKPPATSPFPSGSAPTTNFATKDRATRHERFNNADGGARSMLASVGVGPEPIEASASGLLPSAKHPPIVAKVRAMEAGRDVTPPRPTSKQLVTSVATLTELPSKIIYGLVHELGCQTIGDVAELRPMDFAKQKRLGAIGLQLVRAALQMRGVLHSLDDRRAYESVMRRIAPEVAAKIIGEWWRRVRGESQRPRH